MLFASFVEHQRWQRLGWSSSAWLQDLTALALNPGLIDRVTNTHTHTHLGLMLARAESVKAAHSGDYVTAAGTRT